MILKLAYYGAPVLRKKAAPIPIIDDEIKQLAADLIDTMLDAGNGVGIAAPQVNKSLAIFILQFPKKSDSEEDADEWIPGEIEVFINPKILSVSNTLSVHSEGCLSIPSLYADVPRPVKLTLQAQNLQGEVMVREFEGIEARMIMHENDHLNGVLFIDRIDPKVRKKFEPTLRKIKQQHAH